MNAIMTDFKLDDVQRHLPREWEGFAEVDRAIAENRLTEYRWKKAWADPWNRRLLIFIFVMLAAFIAWVIYEDLIMR